MNKCQVNSTAEVVPYRKISNYSEELSFHWQISAITAMAKKTSHMNFGAEEHVVLQGVLKVGHQRLWMKCSLNYLQTSNCGKAMLFLTVGHIKIEPTWYRGKIRSQTLFLEFAAEARVQISSRWITDGWWASWDTKGEESWRIKKCYVRFWN